MRGNLESKHSPEDIAEQQNILRKSVPDRERMLRWKDFLGRAAAMDNLLDALAETDKTGLRMEIWY